MERAITANIIKIHKSINKQGIIKMKNKTVTEHIVRVFRAIPDKKTGVVTQFRFVNSAPLLPPPCFYST